MAGFAALVAGLLFGLGLAVSQMVNALKVLGFLDVFGAWDPSLALVMGAAIAVTMPGFFLLKGMEKPLFTPRFQWPQRRDIDPKLLVGAGIFGVGWGLAGYCPGPGFGALALNLRGEAFWEPFYFVAAMLVGFLGWHLISILRSPPDG
jgi:uncharacterized protein